MGGDQKLPPKKTCKQWMIDYVASVNPPPTGQHGRDLTVTRQQVFNVTASRKPWLPRLAVTMVNKDMTCGDISWLVSSKDAFTDILDAIIFHGKAGNIIVGLGIENTVQDIFQKGNSIFRAIDTEADLLPTFCGAHQGPKETVAGRGCRLEGLLDSATRQPHPPPPPFCG